LKGNYIPKCHQRVEHEETVQRQGRKAAIRSLVWSASHPISVLAGEWHSCIQIPGACPSPDAAGPVSGKRRGPAPRDPSLQDRSERSQGPDDRARIPTHRTGACPGLQGGGSPPRIRGERTLVPRDRCPERHAHTGTLSVPDRRARSRADPGGVAMAGPR